MKTKKPKIPGIDELNRQEFFSIIQNDKLSKSEIWENVEKWSEKQTAGVRVNLFNFFLISKNSNCFKVLT